MKRLVLFRTVLSMLFALTACSGGGDSDDVPQMGDYCAHHMCEADKLYWCSSSTCTVTEVTDCDQICDTLNIPGEWVFDGECGDTVNSSGDYYECCNCRNDSNDDIYCALY